MTTTVGSRPGAPGELTLVLGRAYDVSSVDRGCRGWFTLLLNVGRSQLGYALALAARYHGTAGDDRDGVGPAALGRCSRIRSRAAVEANCRSSSTTRNTPASARRSGRPQVGATLQCRSPSKGVGSPEAARCLPGPGTGRRPQALAGGRARRRRRDSSGGRPGRRSAPSAKRHRPERYDRTSALPLYERGPVVIHEGAVGVKSRVAVFDVGLCRRWGDQGNRSVVEGVSGLCPGLVVLVPGEGCWVKRRVLRPWVVGAVVGA